MQEISAEPVLEEVHGIKINPQFAYFCGAMRDGTMPKPYDNHFEISIGQKCAEWLEQVVKPIMVSSLEIPPEKVLFKPQGTPRLVVFSKEKYLILSEILGHKGGKNLWGTPRIISENPVLWKGYCRGFFDSEGEVPFVSEYLNGIYSTKPRARIRIHQGWSSETGCPPLSDLKHFIESIGVETKGIYGPKLNKNTFDFDLHITGLANVADFSDKIGSSHPEKSKRLSQLLSFLGKRNAIPRRLIGGLHEWRNERPTVPILDLVNLLLGEHAEDF